ncbi:MAG: DNA mismatch repair protein MutS [Candidatus Lindowbacteria bacterium RIFCSPLOWO2_12_FULL_62_27]|nr:MAG: DNA mismatch repair protein MutS [Candidatus Lindowbacteria bacterium RIFCSPLOWO2_12_FULL_62_27]OGH63442.1 MAG: DNA mismatch repair protein MutS [Candidatus Lindowbacteria bacterium RIFCSPLOWO2_02_FULL_62_12]
METTGEIRLHKLTPLIRQYQSIKRGVGDAILFFRLGDFYEMFNEDAVAASQLLGLYLTKKSAGAGNSVPLAGVPVHSADSYIARLVKAGRKVAICEQVDAGRGKGLMDRAVIRIVTPGTLVEENLLAPNLDNRLAALAWADDRVGLACVDVSTGDFEVGEWRADSDALKNAFEALSLRELVLPDAPAPAGVEALANAGVPACRRRAAGPDEVIETLNARFGAGVVEASGLRRQPAAILAVGLVLRYLAETKSDHLPLRFPRTLSRAGVMDLDAATVRNLEILAGLSGDAQAGLWPVIDRTRTAMGSRLLRRWLLAPLRAPAGILARQEVVSALVDQPDILDRLREALAGIGDMERILARLARPATARVTDLLMLRSSLESAPLAVTELGRLPETAQQILSLDDFPDPSPIRRILADRLAEAPGAVLGEGKVIKAGVHPELDELRDIVENQRLHLLKFQDTERTRSNIASLKVSYNRIYGYYIEISKSNLDSVPADYIRKQTLVNAERFVTPDLKRFEEKLLAASDRISHIERELFSQLLSDILLQAEPVRKAAELLARADALAALAETARRERFVRPQLTEDDVLEIHEGRHPVVERFCPDGFVPNDTLLTPDRRLAIVTGPNMAGKSTFIRQTAVLTLLAQIGSFVPAKAMRWRPVDRIFTRIGASDDLSRGQSTFFVEMSETAAILRQATRDSLILLDEIGRGTSTYDGLSIAWAVAEHIATSLQAKTLFATHYHELADIAGQQGVHTLTVLVREWEGRVVFLRKVTDGASDRSFGIAVADLAGLPRSVLERARALLTQLESASQTRRPAAPGQEDLFTAPAAPDPHSEWKSRIRQMPLDRMTPIEVVSEIARWQKEIQ